MGVEYNGSDDILLSICFPSRNRPLQLMYTLDFFLNEWSDKINMEICVKLDTDDFKSLNVIEKYKKYNNVKFIINDKLNGYLSLSKFWCDLIDVANGKFIFFYNDDIIIENTNDFLDKLIEYENECVIFKMTDFPCVSKKIIDVLKMKYPDKDTNYFFGKDMVFLDTYFGTMCDISIYNKIYYRDMEKDFAIFSNLEIRHFQHLSKLFVDEFDSNSKLHPSDKKIQYDLNYILKKLNLKIEYVD